MTRATEVDAPTQPAPPGIWETYDGQIMVERQKGKPLEQVGSEFGGVSRQRVSQVLIEHYGTTRIRLPTEKEVASQLGISHTHLRALRKEGIVKPQKYGARWRYSKRDIQKVKSYIKEHCVCPMCGGHKSISSRACSSCWQRHRWLLADEEGKKRLCQQNESWQQRNPDRYRESQRRACRKWRNKNREGSDGTGNPG